MCCSSKGHPGQQLARLLLVAGLSLSSECVSTLPCLADAPPLPSVPKKVGWVNGPTKVDLGSVAQARILEGFRFTDPEGAKALLDSTHAVVPDGLLGVISPASGEYYVVLQYNPLGYVKDTTAQALDEDAILKAIWDRTTRQNAQRLHEGNPNIVHVEWVLKPSFDANSHLLESSVRTDGRADNQSLVNYTLQRLGRHGVLQASVVKPRKDFSDFGIVREAIRAISFKSGEDYRDYKEGDKLAAAGLTELITADNSPTGSYLVASANPVPAGTSGLKIVWIAFGVIGCVGIAGSVLIARKFRQYRASQPVQSAAGDAPAERRPEKGRNGSTRLKLDIRSKPAYKPQHNHANGNGAKRKRMFNYHKFYTEMVLQGPSPAVAEPMPGFNGHNNGFNGYNGYYNGHGNGAETPAPAEHAPAAHASASPSPAVLNAHSELIASQRALIEEQKRLIHEQARLIDEKSKLIAEKNRLLDRQSQMIDNNLL